MDPKKKTTTMKPPETKLPTSVRAHAEAQLPRRGGKPDPLPEPDHVLVLRALKSKLGHIPGLDGWGEVSPSTVSNLFRHDRMPHEVPAKDDPIDAHVVDVLEYLAHIGELELQRSEATGRVRVRLTAATNHVDEFLSYVSQREVDGWWRPRGREEIAHIGPKALDVWKYLLERGHVEANPADGLSFRLRMERASTESVAVITETLAVVWAARGVQNLAVAEVSHEQRALLENAVDRAGVPRAEGLRVLIHYWASTWSAEKDSWSLKSLLLFASTLANARSHGAGTPLPPPLTPRFLLAA